MSGSENKIQIVVEAYNMAKSTLDALGKQIKAIGDESTGAGQKHDSVFAKMKENWVALSVVAIELKEAFSKAFEFAELSAKGQQAEESFRNVAAAAGESADEILAAMKKAANGTMDDSAMMQKAVKGMVQGLSGDQIVQVMEASRVAARVAGVDVQTAYEGITDAIANKMPKGLKQFGLVTKEQMKLLDASMSAGITSINLFDLAMANSADQRKKVAGDAGITENPAEKIQKLKALWEGIKETIGGVIWDFIAAIKHLATGTVDVVMGILTGAVTGIFGIFLLLQTGLNKIGLYSDERLKETQATFDKLKKGASGFFSAAGDEFSGKNPKPPTQPAKASAQGKSTAELEAEMKSNLASKAREAEIQREIANLDIAEKDRSISHVDAAQKRVSLAQDLLATQEKNLTLIDKEAVGGAQAWANQMKAIDDTKKKITDFRLALRELNGDFQSGFEEGLRRYIDSVGSTFQQAIKLAQETAQAMEQAFSDFFFDAFTGKLKHFSDYINAFLESVARAIANIMAQKAAAGLAESVAGSGTMTNSTTGSGDLKVAHTGALVRHSGGYIPRFHAGGLNSDERMVINKVGERYITQEQNDWLTKIANSTQDQGAVNIQVSVENKSSQPVSAKTSGVKFDGKAFVVGVILNDLDKGGPIRSALAGGIT
jgi:hypothetical protein